MLSSAFFKCNIAVFFVFFQLASQPLCDVTVLQQIDEETTCDNNPWAFKWTLKPLQIAGTLGLDILPFMTLENLSWIADENYICGFWEGLLAKTLSTLLRSYHIKYYSCTKFKGSACTRLLCFSHETSQNVKLSIRLMRQIFVMFFSEKDFRDIERVFKVSISSYSCFFFQWVLWY